MKYALSVGVKLLSLLLAAGTIYGILNVAITGGPGNYKVGQDFLHQK